MLHNSSCCVFLRDFKLSALWLYHLLSHQEVKGGLTDGEEPCCFAVRENLLLVLLQDSVESMQSIDSCEYIWEAGVGFAQSPPLNYIHDLNR